MIVFLEAQAFILAAPSLRFSAAQLRSQGGAREPTSWLRSHLCWLHLTLNSLQPSSVLSEHVCFSLGSAAFAPCWTLLSRLRFVLDAPTQL